MSSDNDNNNNHGTRYFFLTFFPHCHPLNEFDYFYYFIYVGTHPSTKITHTYTPSPSAAHIHSVNHSFTESPSQLTFQPNFQRKFLQHFRTISYGSFLAFHYVLAHKIIRFSFRTHLFNNTAAAARELFFCCFFSFCSHRISACMWKLFSCCFFSALSIYLQSIFCKQQFFI